MEKHRVDSIPKYDANNIFVWKLRVGTPPPRAYKAEPYHQTYDPARPFNVWDYAEQRITGQYATREEAKEAAATREP